MMVAPIKVRIASDRSLLKTGLDMLPPDEYLTDIMGLRKIPVRYISATTENPSSVRTAYFVRNSLHSSDSMTDFRVMNWSMMRPK
jgi:hypothetical protein